MFEFINSRRSTVLNTTEIDLDLFSSFAIPDAELTNLLDDAPPELPAFRAKAKARALHASLKQGETFPLNYGQLGRVTHCNYVTVHLEI